MNKRTIKRITAVLIALVVAMAVLPQTSYARTVKAANISVGTKMSVFHKKVKSLKTGITTIKYNTSNGYLKFKATKSKTYKVTFSALKESTDVPVMVGCFEKLKNGNTLYPMNVKTNEGKRKYLPITTSKIEKLAKQKGVKTFESNGVKYKYLSKRNVSLTLKKGQTIYFNVSGTGTGTFKINIK